MPDNPALQPLHNLLQETKEKQDGVEVVVGVLPGNGTALMVVFKRMAIVDGALAFVGGERMETVVVPTGIL